MAVVAPVAIAGAPPSKRIRTKTSPSYAQLVADLGGENADASQVVYLGTVSRVLPSTAAAGGYRDIATLTKSELPTMVRDSFDNPAIPAGSGGRPRTRDGSPVDLVVVSKEKHADGSPHFHFVVKLLWTMRFKSAKDTLRERHSLPSHWSCTHAKLFSAIRYVHEATPQKPDVPPPSAFRKNSSVLAFSVSPSLAYHISARSWR